MSLLKKIASNTASQVGAKFINAAISVVIVKIITSTLGKIGYGQYALAYEFLALFLIIADLGLFTIAVREMSDDDKKVRRLLGNVTSMRLGLSFLLSAIAIGLAFVMPGYSTEVKYGIVIVAISMSINLLSITISSALQVKLLMTWNALALVLGKVVMLAYIIYTALFISLDTALYHFLFAGLLGNTLTLLITAISTHVLVTPLALYFDFDQWKDLFKKTWTYGMSLVFVAFFMRIGTVILNYFHGPEAVGTYQAPYRVFELFMLVPIVMMNSVLPVMRQRINTKDIQPIIQHSFHFLATIGLGLMAGTLVLADPVIKLLFHESFTGSATVLIILTLASLFVFLYTIFSYYLLALNKQHVIFVITGIVALGSILFNLALIPKFGYLGASWAIVITQALVFLFTYLQSRKYFSFTIRYDQTLKSLFAAILMGGLVYAIYPGAASQLGMIAVPLVVAIGIGFFLLCLYVFGAVPQEMLNFFLKRSLAFDQSKKTIAIDVRSTIGAKAGKGWYVYQLLESMGKFDQTHTYLLYARHDFHLPPSLPKNFKKRILPLPLLVWHIGVLIDVLFRKVDIIFAPSSYIIPSLYPFKQKPRVVLVIHDIVSFLFPKKHNKKATAIEKSTLKAALRHAKDVICVSENTKRDVQKWFDVPSKKLHVIPEAARRNFKELGGGKDVQRTLRKYQLPERYILFYGTLEPRKNLVRLVKAFSLLPKNALRHHKLVIVGKKGWYWKDIFKTVQELELSDQVIFTGYVPDEDLPLILHGATMMVFPSLYEGFGLPVLEAFACGTPVVTSNTPAILEVADDACEIVDPLDEFAICEAMQRLLDDGDYRKELRAKGLARVKQFDWDDTAKNVLKVLHS